jgi:Raf kinase inhibitor-like YbhB/YbcL family protein
MSRWLPFLVGLLVALVLGVLSTNPILSVSQSLNPVAVPFQSQSLMTLTSPAFNNGERIPSKYTCDGADVSPPLNWTQIPHQTKTFTLILDDPNADGFTHWVIFNIPAILTGLQENVPRTGKPYNSPISQGMNGFGLVGYNGPCPPSGTHRYWFRLYALDTALTLSAGTTKQSVLAAINGHVLGQVDLMGLYR